MCIYRQSRLITSLLLAITLCLIITSVGSANSSEKKPGSDGQKIVKSYRVTENGLVELTLDQVAKLYKDGDIVEKNKNNIKSNMYNIQNNIKGIVTPQAPAFCGTVCIWDVYKQSHSYLTPRPTKRERVTPPVSPGGKVSFSVNESYTWEVNLTFNSNLKKALDIALGGSWSQSSQYQQTINVEAPYNKYAWYDFTPIMRNSYGITEHWENSYYTSWKDKVQSTEFTDIYMVNKVGGFQDGILQYVESDTPPNY
ncbi:hypothetical protein [Paenibacillus sp. FJAT-26967]|uniref:hypothetical protein n=1 Tax=Paenibacillus sp. FJAT-26967 TaxID=1729690 RepID=UPI000839066C|nr:hypothetical protein [Paenibacillus sp. FJAT-26967]